MHRHPPTHRRRRSRHRSPVLPFVTVLAAALLAAWIAVPAAATPVAEQITDAVTQASVDSLVATHGEDERPRIETGVAQVASLWRPEDGDADAFQDFVEQEFVPTGDELDLTFQRFEFAMERIGGWTGRVPDAPHPIFLLRQQVRGPP